MSWIVLRNEEVEIDIDNLASRVAQLRGPDYVARWDEGLSVAMESLADFPGPRSFPQSIAESERRRAEVRRGGDGRSVRRVRRLSRAGRSRAGA